MIQSRENGMSGIFIVIEGIDGSGKSTLCRVLRDLLEAKGHSVIITQEPTYDEIGTFIRNEGVKNISQKGEALLFTADRAVHTERIERWMAEGKTVICDRYYASTIAYQSSPLNGDALDREWLMEINRPVVIEPDLTVLLDIDPDVGLKRIGGRCTTSKFENTEYLLKVRSAYLELAEEFGYMVVDAAADQGLTSEEILSRLKERI